MAPKRRSSVASRTEKTAPTRKRTRNTPPTPTLDPHIDATAAAVGDALSVTPPSTAVVSRGSSQSPQRRQPHSSAGAMVEKESNEPSPASTKKATRNTRKSAGAGAAAAAVPLDREVKPSVPRVTPLAPLPAAQALALNPTATPGLQAAFETALLEHLRGALVQCVTTVSKRPMFLTTDGSPASNRNTCGDGKRREEEEYEEEEADEDEEEKKEGEEGKEAEKDKRSMADSAVENKRKTEETKVERKEKDAETTNLLQDIDGHAVLPCVHYFIAYECARLAKMVREGDDGGLGDNPTERALELFGYFIALCSAKAGMATMLVLACPSCRLAGIVEERWQDVLQFLLLTQRITAKEAAQHGKEVGSWAIGRLSGCRDAAGKNIEPAQCCPYGAAHMHLHLLLCASAFLEGSMCIFGMVTFFVPFLVHGIDDFPASATGYFRQFDRYYSSVMGPTNLKFHYTKEGDIATRHLQKGDTPPVMSPTMAETLMSKAGKTSWAETFFADVFPRVKVSKEAEPAVSLVKHIRDAYTYACADGTRRGGHCIFTLRIGKAYQRAQPPSSTWKSANRIFSEHLFTWLTLQHHIADGVRRRNSRSTAPATFCSCYHEATVDGSEDAIPLHAEDHVSFLAALHRSREELHVLLDASETGLNAEVEAGGTPVLESGGGSVKATAFVPTGGERTEISFYTAGSMARFLDTLDESKTMNATQIIDLAAKRSLEGMDGRPAVEVPHKYIRAELKRHQLEDVQWMLARELEGFSEFVSVPLSVLYRTRPGKARLSDLAPPSVGRLEAQDVGTLYYCATTQELVMDRRGLQGGVRFSRANTNLIRGGLLCDDVGLGKTLSILTLCACDRVLQEEKEEQEVGEEVSLSVAQAVPHFWRITERVTTKTKFPSALRSAAFHRCPFTDGIVRYTTPPTPLPRTTLVVVPLVIATQWIDELRKFYPSATYLLFYGAHRTQYTVKDLQRADFVITTYETLSSHLREEADGVRFWVAQDTYAADAALCATLTAQGCAGLHPSQAYAALRTFAEEVVWAPLADAPHPAGAALSRNPGIKVTFNYDQRNCWSRSAASSPTDDWYLFISRTSGNPVFRFPSGCIELVVNDTRFPDAGNVSAGRWAAFYGNFWDSAPHTTSDDFLDKVWDLLDQCTSPASIYSKLVSFTAKDGLFDHSEPLFFFSIVFKTFLCNPLCVEIRRKVVRRLLLPSLWRVLETYWRLLASRYAAEAVIEVGGPAPFRMTDLFFRRVVLDESQKCGSSSLYHLLQAERRWAVTGTPLNNNKLSSLSAPLSFLGMSSAAALLALTPKDVIGVQNCIIPSHLAIHRRRIEDLQQYLVYRLYCLFAARRRKPSGAKEFGSVADICLCTYCLRSAAYGTQSLPASAPAEYQCARLPQRIACTQLPCLPNALVEILSLVMVRHDRNDQIRHELALPPVRYAAHAIPLHVREERVYQRVARSISAAAMLLHRQGLLGSRMAMAMQWVQVLSRLSAHPAMVTDPALLRGDLGRTAPAQPEVLGAEQNASRTEALVATVEGTFQEVSATEALASAQSKVSRATTIPEESETALRELAQNPPLLPMCGICMDDMALPTLLHCLHLFCKECIIGVIEASRTLGGNFAAKCPYCRNAKSMLDLKLVIRVVVPDAQDALEAAAGTTGETPEQVEEELAEVLPEEGSRLCALLDLIESIWREEPEAGILVFSKLPALLQAAHSRAMARGCASQIMLGSSTMAQRQRVMRALQQTGGATPPATRRILFVTSRTANAGLNLTFANHVLFVEPNLNPAMEVQAIGRVHRFGQLKPVVVHHLYAPGTVEDIIYHRSVRLRGEGDTQQHRRPQEAAEEAQEQQRRRQFGRVKPTDMTLLLEYPVPLQS